MSRPKPFRLDDSDPASRLRRLTPAQAEALESALRILGPGWEGPESAVFLLPLAEAGFPASLMLGLASLLPRDWPRDHREVYYDFRLARWCRHLEPPDLAECLDEYVRTAESPEAGLAYAKREWEAFLRRHGSGG